MYGVPASQIEVERLFSVAGYMTSLRRATMQQKLMADLVMINQNWPNDPTKGETPNSWGEWLSEEAILQIELEENPPMTSS